MNIKIIVLNNFVNIVYEDYQTFKRFDNAT